MVAMRMEMDTLKAKHTWDLVKLPPGANIMGSMWVYDIKWDGEGNQIKDKARLVGKGYTQQLGVDYNETWAGVTRLESVHMTAAIAAKFNLKLWRLNSVGAYLNSLTKEDIYMKQPEGFIEPGYEDFICKLIHMIYGTMQGGHDWYKHLAKHITNSATLPPVQIRVSNSKQRTETILLWIPIPMMFLVLQIMMRRLRRERKRLEEYGR
jgi:Reverse transcriptase (RNA-dependent DNA polymerase)